MRAAVRRAASVVLVPALVTLLALSGCGDDGGSGPGAAAALKVSGSTTVNAVAAAAADVLRKDGMRITVDSQGGSAGGIAQLGDGQVDVAMSSKPLADEERSRYPDVDFVATQIGQDAVGVVVRRDVFDGGVTNLTRDQARAVFEGRTTSWKEVGGPDLGIFVYDKEPGRGTREQLDRFLYGPDGKAPPPPDTDNFAIVGGNEETRTKLLSTRGSVGPLSTSFIEGHDELAAVSLDGVEPSVENIRSARYPMARPLFLVTDGPPAGAAKRFIDFILSARGQAIVRKSGFLTRTDLRST